MDKSEPTRAQLLGRAIRAARNAAKLTLQQVGELKGIDASPQAVGQWERGKNGPTATKLEVLGRELKMDVGAALRGEYVPTKEEDSPPRAIRSAGPETSEVEKVGEGWPDVGDEWMDVRGVTVGGDDTFFYFGDVEDRVRKPPGIRNAKNVAALTVVGESMLDKYEPGELIYVQQRVPAPGDYVVIELFPETEGEAGKSFLKKLVRRTGLRLYCKQLNPPAEIEFDMGEVKTIWRVLSLRDLLG